MSTKLGTVTREEARDLKRRSESLARNGGGIPHDAVRGKWLAKLERELRAMVRTYDGSAKKGRELLEALLVAEEAGLPSVADIRHTLAEKLHRKRAA